MPRYLLDTNHLSPLVTEGHPFRRRVLAQLTRGEEFAVPVVVLTEFLYGLHLTARAEQNLAEWRRLQHSFGYYPVGQPEAEAAAVLQIRLRRGGRQLATVDALIAAIAIRHSLILLTTDGDFDAVPDLRCENWLR
jgi:tRNA(fMet)-specific endonuclease VapC